MAFICCYAKGNGIISLMIDIDIIAVMILCSFSIGIWYFYPSDIAQVLFGASSRIMRKDYISLKKEMPRLWGGKSCTFIQDENHLQNTISYIKRHQPHNTKLPNF